MLFGCRFICLFSKYRVLQLLLVVGFIMPTDHTDQIIPLKPLALINTKKLYSIRQGKYLYAGGTFKKLLSLLNYSKSD